MQKLFEESAWVFVVEWERDVSENGVNMCSC